MSTPVSHRKGLMLAMVLGAAMSATPAPAADTLSGISRYCTACWRNARLPADVWGDCTQEVFSRLLERLPTAVWSVALQEPDGPEHRELLRAVDCVKKRIQRAKVSATLPEAGVADDAVTELDRVVAAEELRLAFTEALTPRQAKILTLWSQGYEIPEIASTLGTTAPRVSDDKYKAILRLQSWFNARAV